MLSGHRTNFVVGSDTNLGQTTVILLFFNEIRTLQRTFCFGHSVLDIQFWTISDAVFKDFTVLQDVLFSPLIELGGECGTKASDADKKTGGEAKQDLKKISVQHL